MGRRTKEAPRGDLSADDWARAALYAWGSGGFRAVAVEPLARQLGVTKGSFYWHFESRTALVHAAVELWKREGTDTVIQTLEKIPDPKKRLVELFSMAWDRMDHLRVEAAIGATALTGDAWITREYEKVQRVRLGYVAKLYRQMGFPPAEARRRAITTYSAFLGSLQIVALGDKSLRTDTQLKRQVKVFREMLVERR